MKVDVHLLEGRHQLANAYDVPWVFLQRMVEYLGIIVDELEAPRWNRLMGRSAQQALQGRRPYGSKGFTYTFDAFETADEPLAGALGGELNEQLQALKLIASVEIPDDMAGPRPDARLSHRDRRGGGSEPVLRRPRRAGDGAAPPAPGVR